MKKMYEIDAVGKSTGKYFVLIIVISSKDYQKPSLKFWCTSEMVWVPNSTVQNVLFCASW
jgi:hypothetical protein